MSLLAPTAPSITRRPRFMRADPAPIRVTEDDLAILQHIARHRFLRSTHLARLMPHRSYKKLLERLGALYHNGFIDRPRAQLDYYGITGSAPMVYALGNRGAQVLAEQTGIARGEIDWTWKNRSVGKVFLEHALLTADVMVAAERATAERPDIRLITAEQILANARESTRSANNPFRLKTRASHDGKMMDLAVIPDAVFGLDFTAERKRKYFFLEADRATMPVARSDMNQTSILRKLLAYLAGGGKANAFGNQLGIGNFRVLTVTTSPERTTTMIEALKSLTRGAGSSQFLFVDRAALLANHDLMSLEWTSGKGEQLRLSD